MDIKNLLKVNLINIVLLGLVALLYVVFNNIFEFSTGVTLGVNAIKLRVFKDLDSQKSIEKLKKLFS